jgi:hypothetical protein
MALFMFLASAGILLFTTHLPAVMQATKKKKTNDFN